MDSRGASLKNKLFVIEHGRADLDYWKDLWHFRELMFFLAWRDIVVRYKQTAIGVVWCLIRPMITLIVFTFIFGKLAALPSGGVPYPILVFSALLPWQFFSSALLDSSSSVISNASMVSKVYFPRLLIPASSIVVNFVDFMVSFLILIGLMLWYQVIPTWRILILPLFIMLLLTTALGAGLLFASLNTKFRDFRYIVPFVVQFGVYVSPVGFSSDLVPEQWRLWYSLNPMVAVIDGFRWVIVGGEMRIYWPGFIASCFIIVLLFVIGIMHFRKTEKTFADMI
jgi:lipopolysaccharide transport system permease protein